MTVSLSYYKSQCCMLLDPHLAYFLTIVCDPTLTHVFLVYICQQSRGCSQYSLVVYIAEAFGQLRGYINGMWTDI